MRKLSDKIVPREKLAGIAHEAKLSGKTVAATSGCFDIIHAGHVTYLQDAREMADMLVVLLNSDSSVKALKGNERPIVPEEKKATVLAALESVDYVCIFDEKTPCAAYEEFKPDIVVKGGDYDGKHIPEMDTVAVYGGKVEYVSLVEGCSSSNIIEKIKNSTFVNEQGVDNIRETEEAEK